MPRTQTAHLVVLVVELLIPHSQSLKSKRHVVKSITDKIRAGFNASVAEIDYLDKWQRSVLGISMICNDRVQLERRIAAIDQLLRTNSDIEVLNIGVEWI